MFFVIFNKINILGFQSPVTPVMEGIIDLHNYIFFYLILVFVFVLWMYSYILITFFIKPTLVYDFSYKADKSFLMKVLLFIVFGDEYEKKILKESKITEIQKYLDNIKMVFSKAALNQYKELLETRQIVHGSVIEIVWTILPSITLVFIAIPSFVLLYAMDEIADPRLTVKAIGYQWYWNYEYAHMNSFVNNEGVNIYDNKGLTDEEINNIIGSRENIENTLVFDSVMLTEDDLVEGYHRLLDVDNPMILPVRTHIRVIVTAEDVLHSWAVPSLGVKIDAVPGRLSQIGLYIKHPGVFYGQCSELCGVGHGFMPIVVKVVDYDHFLIWNKNLVGLADSLV